MNAEFSGAQWYKSSHSGPDGHCVEVAFLFDGNVGIRDSKDLGSGPAMAFAPGEWDVFVAGVVDGKLGPA
ncbi:MAG: DUF397 domain-containing protein [Nocardia sp.]|nr:DUF397 domain-containing protein [Nocardia sp.]